MIRSTKDILEPKRRKEIETSQPVAREQSVAAN